MPIDFKNSLSATGNIDVFTVQDPDVDPNTVLEIDADWKVRAHWFVDSPNFAYIAGGTWHLAVNIESMGQGQEKTLANLDVAGNDLLVNPPVGNRLEYQKEITIPKRGPLTPPALSINDEGIYKLVLVLTYSNPLNMVDRIAGFHEGLMIQFYDFA